MQLFRFLKFGLAVILVFIGAKMLCEHWVTISITASLVVIGCVLTMSVLASVLIKDPNSNTLMMTWNSGNQEKASFGLFLIS